MHFFLEVELPSPPVIWVWPPLNQFLGNEPIDMPDKRDRFDFQQLGERRLIDAFATAQLRENPPLRTGQAEFAGARIETHTDKARNVAEQKAERSC